MFLLRPLRLTAINLSFSFRLLETSATALCGTTGILFLPSDVGIFFMDHERRIPMKRPRMSWKVRDPAVVFGSHLKVSFKLPGRFLKTICFNNLQSCFTGGMSHAKDIFMMHVNVKLQFPQNAGMFQFPTTRFFWGSKTSEFYKAPVCQAARRRALQKRRSDDGGTLRGVVSGTTSFLS